ncbi:MAG TPA: hypothetical protein VJY62_04715 [Bacteroidia bacterium]|nr:hypothetical protein [Bacteroidia bacterium]
MKKIWIIFLITMLNNLLKAQVNLVTNGDFEQFDTCPDNASQIHHTISWFQPTLGTPDYFNACAPPIPTTYFSVPANYFGYQSAHSGEGYVGVFLYYFTSNQTTYREYIEAKLSDTLVAGQKYFINFFVSLSDSSNTATDDLGVYFSNNSITSNNWNELPVNAQVENLQGNFLIDKLNWMEFQGDFISQGGELYITIGNFKNFFNTDSLHVVGGG